MKTEIMLTLRLRSPLALHRSRSSVQYVETLDYIPGTTLRGALAEAYLAEHGTPDDVFQALFLSDRVFYGDLWPALSDRSTVLIPATAQACKRYGLTHKASFRDSLLDALPEEQGEIMCSQCTEPLDRVTGYLRMADPIEPLSVRCRLRVNTAIDRGTGSVAREMLFTRHTLVSKRKGDDGGELFFRGPIGLADPGLQSELSPLLAAGSHLFLGAGRSRGLGEVEVVEWKRNSPGETLEERWRLFNETAKQAGGDADKRYFSLTLPSHLALRNNLLRPVLEEIGHHHFGLPDGVEWVRYQDSDQPVRFLNTVTVPGWNAAQGLPKPDTVALARGSVLFFQCDASLEEAVCARLSEIEAEGFGDRCNEGFGRVVACYPIHYQCWRK